MAERSAHAPPLSNEDAPGAASTRAPPTSGIRRSARPDKSHGSDVAKQATATNRPAVRVQFGNLPSRVVPLFERLTRLEPRLLADMLDELRSELAARGKGPDIRLIRRACVLLEALGPAHVVVPVGALRMSIPGPKLDEALLGAQKLGRLALRPARRDVDPTASESFVVGPSGRFGAIAPAPARTVRKLLAEAREVCSEVGRLLDCDDVLRAGLRRLDRMEQAIHQQPTLEDAVVLGAIAEGKRQMHALPGVPLSRLRDSLLHTPRSWVDRRLLSLRQSGLVELFPMKRGAPFADPFAALFDGMGEFYYCRLTDAGHEAAAATSSRCTP